MILVIPTQTSWDLMQWIYAAAKRKALIRIWSHTGSTVHNVYFVQFLFLSTERDGIYPKIS